MRSIALLITPFTFLLAVPCTADADQPEEPSSAFELSALYVADALWNMQGGLQEGGTYLDYLEVAAGIDAGSALGWNGLELYASAFYRNDATFSER